MQSESGRESEQSESTSVRDARAGDEATSFDEGGKSGRMIPIVSYVRLKLSIIQTSVDSARVVCDDWGPAVMQQALRQHNVGGLERVAEWSRVRGGQLQWNQFAGGVTPGDARVRRGAKVAIVDAESGSLARDDFLWLQRILSPFSKGATMVREWCQKTLTNRIYQHMLLHYNDGFDADGTPFVRLYLRLRLMKNLFEAPWRFLYQIKLDGTPMLFVNGKDTLGEMYVVTMMYYDETGYGTYEFFCRTPHGTPFSPSSDPSTPAAGLLLNGGAPGRCARHCNAPSEARRRRSECSLARRPLRHAACLDTMLASHPLSSLPLPPSLPPFLSISRSLPSLFSFPLSPISWEWNMIDGSSTYTTRRILPADQPVPLSLDEVMSFPVVFSRIDYPDGSLELDPASRCYDTEYVVP